MVRKFSLKNNFANIFEHKSLDVNAKVSSHKEQSFQSRGVPFYKNHILSRLTLIIWFTAVAVLFSGRAGDVASYSSSFSSLFPLSLRVSSLVTLRPSVARGLFAPWFNTPELLIGMDAIGTTYEIGMASENDGKNKFRNVTTKALSRKTNK